MVLKEKIVIFFATGFFVGNIPFAPGTFGTTLGLPLSFFLSKIDTVMAVLCIAVFIIFAIWIAHRAQEILKNNDPGCVVIDEVAGFLITMTGVPLSLISMTAGFFIFRTMDIVKPFPIRLIERKTPGGTGIVLDDLLAGIYANLVLRLFLLLKDML